jgi:hypothetical protein
MRFLLTEAKRSGQAQVSAYGVTTSWRSHWTGRLTMIDGLLKQLPAEADEAPAPVGKRYFYHPESDSPMITVDGSHPGTDGLVEELTEAEYEDLMRRRRIEDTPAAPPVINDTDLDDLLG